MTHTERAQKFRARHGRAPSYTPTHLPPHSGARTLLEWEPCAFEGDVLETCHSCKQGSRDVRECEKHNTIATRSYVSHRARACVNCADYRMAPGAVVRYDETNFYPNIGGWRFNASCITFKGENYLSWRDGWAGSEVWVSKTDHQWRPTGAARKLDLFHADANYGREDGQLFVFRDQLHIAYVGVVGRRHGVWKTSVLYARLSDQLETEQIFTPRAPRTDVNRWEKNWGFFEVDGHLHAVYTIRPHVVFVFECDKCLWEYERPGPPWTGGEARGSVPPVRVGDEFWNFFHDSVTIAGRQTYRIGLYTFEAKHPFRPLRVIPDPILISDKTGNTHGNYCEVLFPRGAVLRNDVWTISSGEHDRYFTLRTLDHKALEKRLVRI